jgi:PAS domain S-box-containing protein
MGEWRLRADRGQLSGHDAWHQTRRISGVGIYGLLGISGQHQFTVQPATRSPARTKWDTIAIDTQSATAHPGQILPRAQAWLAFQAMEKSDDIMIVLETDHGGETADAVIVGVNGAFHHALGFSDDDILGRPAAELFPLGGDAETLMDAIRAGTAIHTELRCCRASGGTIMLGIHLMPAPAQADGRVCFVLLARDITAVIQSRQMQDSIHRLLAKVFTTIEEAVVIVSERRGNTAGCIVMTNPGVDRLLGYKPNSLTGRNSLDLVAAGSRDMVATHFKQQSEQGGDSSFRAPLVTASGPEFDAQITSVLVATDGVSHFRIVTLRQHIVAANKIRSESVGKIKLVGLDEVRRALGSRWPAVASRAMATAEAVIKRRCGPTDSYSQADDTSFLMCFGSLSEEESSFRAAMIGREIRDRLVGQGEAPANSYVRSLAAVIQFPDKGETGSQLHAVLLTGLDQQLERLELAARETLKNAPADTRCDLEPVRGRISGEAVAMQVHLHGQLERSLVSALSVLPLAEAKAFDMDGLLLQVAAQQAINSLVRGDAVPFLVNVSFDVFASRAATESFFATCLRLDPRVCGRLILLLSKLPYGLPPARLLECVNRLRPFCCGVGYNIDDLADLALIDLSNSFNPIAAFQMAALADSPPQKIKPLIDSLHARRVRIMVRGVTSEKGAAAFRSLGADMISIERG